MTSPTVHRLEFGDDLFLRRYRGLGSPVVSQYIWRTVAPVEEALLRRRAEALGRGRLHRALARHRLPGARDAWVRSPQPAPEPTRSTVEDVWAWGAALAHERTSGGGLVIDPHEGRSWRLDAADLPDGSGAVSLMLSHAVADWGAVVAAVEEAVCEDTGAAPRTLTTRAPDVRADLAELGTRVAALRDWVGARAERAALPSPPTAAAPPPGRADLDPAWRPPTVVLALDSAELGEAARARGGSGTSLFTAIAAGVTRRLGRVGEHDAVATALPVDTRRADSEAGEGLDLRANATRIAMAPIEPIPDRDAEDALASVRAASKAAYVRLGRRDHRHDPVPLALIQALPDPVLRRIPEPPPAALLASTVGRVPDAVVEAFGPAASMTVGVHQVDASPEDLPGAGGVTAWLCDAGEVTTMSLTAALPQQRPTEEEVRAAMTQEIRAWGLTESAW